VGSRLLIEGLSDLKGMTVDLMIEQHIAGIQEKAPKRAHGWRTDTSIDLKPKL
jgi:hypothetical protein